MGLARKMLTDIAMVLVPLVIDLSLKSYADYRRQQKAHEKTTLVEHLTEEKEN